MFSRLIVRAGGKSTVRLSLEGSGKMMSWICPTSKCEHFPSAEWPNEDANTDSILSSCSFMDPALALCLLFRLVAMGERGNVGAGGEPFGLGKRQRLSHAGTICQGVPER